MTIGLTGTDLRKKFKTIYDEELAAKQFHYESLRGGYEVYNPERMTQEVAKLDLRLMATWEALLSVIEANNAKILSQLEQKGIDV